ncbi:hypothetical protein PUNSTDRAFT_51486 [Punctularia strigosozonata HHB-11173 SS5]|uniref:uncharacterized protein n=1 Tax=Punctularia strigosozonata (strain HHB-11173) TaxID=741275 RepID=UPI00044182E2|nr:uncharacterized protein PUNSTDRAFT_51486 [Punctularia strigosozonata HHB-11173 SS5]EIN10912.1 hypothetical protein PUNSTDRAFT_51486 [Punctularia strigosozonata HHB-11173 SS5]
MPGELLKKRKIAVLGSRSVGKSSLVVQFVDNQFVDSYYPTIESTYTKTVNYNGVEYECDIIDTAGQDEYSILNSKHAIGIHGFVLVYSVTNRSSLNMIQIIYDKIIDFCGQKEIPCVIVGSKTDLTSIPSRQVDADGAKKIADANHAAFVETSAKNNVNVGKVFQLCLQEIEKHSPSSKAEPPKTPCVIM